MILTVDAFNLIALLILKPLCAIGLCAYLLKTNPVRSAARNQWLVFLGILSPLMVIAAYLILPSISIPALPAAWLQEIIIDVEQLIEGETWGTKSLLVIFALYLLGVGWGVSFLINGLIEMFWISQRAQLVCDGVVFSSVREAAKHMRVTRQVEVKMSSELDSPVMWGAVNPTILMPSHSATWGEAALVRVLSHELAHVKRADWLVKIGVHLLCSVFWFVLPLWWLAKKNEWFSELACDDLVVEALGCRAEYANDLLQFATHDNRSPSAALGFLKKSELFERINAVLDGSKTRASLGLSAKILLICVWALLLAPLSAAYVSPAVERDALHVVEYYPLWLPSDDSMANKRANSESVFSQSSAYDRGGRDKHKRLVSTQKTITLSLAELQSHYAPVPMNSAPAESVRVVFNEPAEGKQAYIPKPEPLRNHMNADLAKRPEVQLEGFLPINLVTPHYPHRALQRGIEGRVKVRFDINTQGKAVNAKVIEASAKGVFDKVVLDALAKSEFQPIRINGHPIITKDVKETFLFTLNSPTQ